MHVVYQKEKFSTRQQGRDRRMQTADFRSRRQIHSWPSAADSQWTSYYCSHVPSTTFQSTTAAGLTPVLLVPSGSGSSLKNHFPLYIHQSFINDQTPVSI